ncbi:MAG TPA: hypothetical protein VFD01_23010 [Candidatus Dormibacteraeota bacterium]|jgi:hypothetical protein|nr:hypothetical protein [Candidatus Dormibacteraeota bacterium]
MGEAARGQARDPDRLASELELGALQRRHRTVLPVHLGQILGGLAMPALTCLILWNALHGVTGGPGWMGLLGAVIGPLLSAWLLWLGWQGFQERQVLLRYERG